MAEREEPKAGTRVPGNLVHVLPRDEDSAARVIEPLLRRVDAGGASPQLIVLTPDADDAVAIARALNPAGDARIVPLSAEARGARLLAARAPKAVAAPPAVLLALVRRSALKLDGLTAVVLAWADEILALEEGPALEMLMTDVPRDAGRVLITGRLDSAVEGIVERYLRRAHRLGPSAPAEPPAPVTVEYVSSTPATRRAALRRVLDELDPPSAGVFARTERGLAEAREALADLGYPPGDRAIAAVSGAADPAAQLIVLYELPATAEELREVAAAGPASGAGPESGSGWGSGARRVIALAGPRELDRLRALAGGPVTPLAQREPLDRARRREEAIREELRAELRRGAPDREMLALAPLLDEHDAVEIAAAALRLRERASERAAAESPVSPTQGSPRTVAWTRLFITAGTRDNVRPGDLVGLITGEGGITSDRIGRIELRESHALVEIAADAADQVVRRVGGAQVKGRRVVVRPERPRDPRGRGGGEREGRSAPGRTAARGGRRERPTREPGRGGAGRVRPRGDDAEPPASGA